jgi:hypothetical protein
MEMKQRQADGEKNERNDKTQVAADLSKQNLSCALCQAKEYGWEVWGGRYFGCQVSVADNWRVTSLLFNGLFCIKQVL